MKHIIIGSGVIGRATGELLEAHNQDVTYNDVNADLMAKLKDKHHKKIDFNIRHHYDLYWICTAEWDVEDIINTIKDIEPNIVIRSTIKPHDLEHYQNKYNIDNIAHIPEFLRESTATQDIFNSDRIVIGTDSIEMKMILNKIFFDCYCSKIYCTPRESSLIKLVANNWLSMQISFWNEIKNLCDVYKDVNPQLVSNAVTLDHRISKYGSNMIGKPFQGFCFPKDTKSLADVFKDKNMKARMIDALINVNKEMK